MLHVSVAQLRYQTIKQPPPSLGLLPLVAAPQTAYLNIVPAVVTLGTLCLIRLPFSFHKSTNTRGESSSLVTPAHTHTEVPLDYIV